MVVVLLVLVLLLLVLVLLLPPPLRPVLTPLAQEHLGHNAKKGKVCSKGWNWGAPRFAGSTLTFEVRALLMLMLLLLLLLMLLMLGVVPLLCCCCRRTPLCRRR